MTFCRGLYLGVLKAFYSIEALTGSDLIEAQRVLAILNALRRPGYRVRHAARRPARSCYSSSWQPLGFAEGGGLTWPLCSQIRLTGALALFNVAPIPLMVACSFLTAHSPISPKPRTGSDGTQY